MQSSKILTADDPNMTVREIRASGVSCIFIQREKKCSSVYQRPSISGYFVERTLLNRDYKDLGNKLCKIK